MSMPILTTKLYVPPPRPNLLVRPRLIEQLNRGLRHAHGFGRKLTLISAPAGFGKTTLVCEWVAALRAQTDAGTRSARHQAPIVNLQVAWLSLDEADSDPARFLRYLVAALQTAAAHVGQSAADALQSPQPPPLESILTALLNDIAALPDPLILVLDDYHVIDASTVDTTPSVDDALIFLLEHLPPPMHLVITTREDPPFPLARYRARGHMIELRAADLRFTEAEAAAFLNQMMDLKLSSADVAALESRTEGWIAGLQMAALSVQGRADATGFIRAFAGDNRYIVDYLAEEVLLQQPAPIRNFLLQTSLLDRLCGPLCDAVVEPLAMDAALNGQETLEYLEQANLFIVPLDDTRHWYRYHHLFADVLYARLQKTQPEQIRALHQRASAWYAQHALPAHAIGHALAAEDFEQAAELIELAWPPIFNGFHPASWLGWVRALPAELVRARPVLSVGYAWTLLDGGEVEGVEERLRDAEQWLDALADTHPHTPTPERRAAGMVVVNEAEFRTLPANIASGRAYLARARGDMPATVHHARRALDLLPAEDHYWRGIAAMFLGQAHQTSGDLAAASRAIADSVASLQRAGHIHFQIVGTVTLADICVAQGRLRAAARIYAEALQLATPPDEPPLPGAINAYAGLGELHREWDELEAATRYLSNGIELAEHAVSPGSSHRLRVAMARIRESQGDWEGALKLLREIERQHSPGVGSDLPPVGALRARLWIRQGRVADAVHWAHEQGLSADDEIRYPHEFEYITLARVRIAEYAHNGTGDAIHAAARLLDRLLHAAEAGERMGRVVEILVLQALAHQAQGDLPAARAALQQALTLAAPEGYIRVFADEGAPMQALLADCLAHGADAAYAARISSAMKAQTSDSTATPAPNQLLIEPLSRRELEVLHLLAQGHSNRAVADELVIAVSTVKKHVNNIFGKLGVASRTQAVRRARELNLV